MESEKSLPPLVIPVLNGDSAPSQLLPIGTEKSGTSGKRSGRFFGLVTGASGSNLQVIFAQHKILLKLIFLLIL